MPAESTFLSYVQQHERMWGTVQYTDRPKLDTIMNAYIVCFWRMVDKKDPNFRITVHKSTDELHQYAAEILLNLHVRPPMKRLAKLFVNHEQYAIKGIKLLAGPAVQEAPKSKI